MNLPKDLKITNPILPPMALGWEKVVSLTLKWGNSLLWTHGLFYVIPACRFLQVPVAAVSSRHGLTGKGTEACMHHHHIVEDKVVAFLSCFESGLIFNSLISLPLQCSWKQRSANPKLNCFNRDMNKNNMCVTLCGLHGT